MFRTKRLRRRLYALFSLCALSPRLYRFQNGDARRQFRSSTRAAPLPTAEYGYVFNDGLQTVAAAAGVRFSTNGVLSAGVTHTAGGNAVVLADAGTYAVWFTVMGTAANQFILYLNDTSVPGTFYGTETGAAGSAVRTLTTGFAIVTAPAGSTLALVNSTGATVTLATGVGGGGPNVNASMMVVKLA